MDTLVRLYGLIFGCPYGKDIETCAFYEIRKKSKIERYNIIQSMSNSELKLLEEKHKSCSQGNGSDALNEYPD